MSFRDEFPDITQPDAPLAQFTWLKVGGSAEFLASPRDLQELKRVVDFCRENDIAVRVIGGGSNLLVRDEGVKGVVIRLAGEEFSQIEIDDVTVRAGAAATLSQVISQTAKAELAGLEMLIGIPGTIGGALRGNAGGRSGDIGQFVVSAKVLTADGEIFTRSEDELSFAYRSSSLNELVVLEGEFRLQRDDPDEITRRMRKQWITKKATQPFSFQSAGCIFKNPRGLSAGALIEQCGLKGTKAGGAEVSDRHANFFVTNSEATAADVLELIETTRTEVSEQFGVDLETEIQIW